MSKVIIIIDIFKVACNSENYCKDHCICSGCLNPVTSAGRTIVDIAASAKLELVDKFCYLGDMLSVDGDADAAVEARIRTGWNKFRQLVPHCLPISTYH